MGEIPSSSSPKRQLTARAVPADEPLRSLAEPGVSEGLHAGETRILEMIARGNSLAEVLDALTRFVESQADGTHCSIAFIDAELRIRPASAPSLSSEYNGALDGVPIFPYIGPCGMAAYLKRQVISENIEADDRWSAAFRAITQKHGLKACWSTPIFDSRASCIGTFAIYLKRPCTPTAHHLGLIEIATRLAGIAIERQLKEERLYVFAEVISRSTEAIRISDHNDKTAEQNAAHREMFGLSDEQLQGQTSAMIFGEEQSAGVLATLKECGQFNGELVARTDGKPRLIDVSAFAVMDQDKKTVCHVALSRDVTEKRHAEEALKDSHTALESLVAQRTTALQQAFDEIKKSEAKLQRVIDTIPTLAWSAGPEGSADFLNQRWLDYTGFTAEQAQGSGWTQAIHPDDLKGLAELWQSSLASGTPVETEARMRRYDASYRWFLFRANPLRDESGKIVSWYGTNIDIEDRKRAEESLRANERQLSLMINAIPTYIQVSQPDGAVLSVNQTVLDYYGLSLEDMQKEDFRDRFYHPEDVERLRELRKEALKHPVPFEYEQRALGKDGRYRWFLVRYKPLLDDQGRVDQWYVAAFDIEDRKQAEAEVKESYLRLAEAQRLSKTGSFITDLVADDHNWSEETFRIFEFDPSTKITVQMIRNMIHAEDLPSFDSMIARAMTGKDVDFSFRLVTSRGAVKHIRGMARVIEHIVGRPLFIGALQDVTDSKVAEEALNRARSELAHVSRVTTLNALTASIAHEINQPLSGIMTNASTCLRMLDGDPPNVDGARETARRMVRDGNRASDVIKRVRALFSKEEFKPEPLDLNDATREVIALSLGDLQKNRVVLRSELADDLALVTGDRVQLQQVILNLLRNASDAMIHVEDRPRELLVTTEREAGDRARLTVKDVGVGFTSGTADKLFEAFHTTKSDGMGIGLSISRSIIEAHRGRLWATANDGPGATFSFSIPCGQAGVSSRQQPIPKYNRSSGRK